MSKNTNNDSLRRDVILAIVLFIAILAIGVIFYQKVENLNLVDSFYFTTATLTTLGYGDIVPRTDIGKIFTSVYAFLGIGMFFGLAGIVFQGALTRSREHRLRKNKQLSK